MNPEFGPYVQRLILTRIHHIYYGHPNEFYYMQHKMIRELVYI